MKRLLLRTGVISLVLAACGTGDESGTSPSPATPPTTAESSVCEPSQVDGDLHAYTRPDYIDPSLIARFEEEFGVDVVEDSYRSSDLVVPKLQSGARYDLIIPFDPVLAALIDGGLLQEIQRDAIPNLSNLVDRFADPPYDPGSGHSVALHWGTVGIGVDLDLVGDGADGTWALALDPERIQGRSVSLLDDPRQAMGAALKYLGYSLNSIDPQQLREAADVITKAIEAGVSFDSDQYLERVSSGGVAVAQGHSASFGAAWLDQRRVGYLVPSEGAAIWVEAMAIPASAGHVCTAHTFIDFLLDPGNGARLASWNRLASSNAAAQQYIDPEVLADESIYPPGDVLARLEFMEDLGAFETEYAVAFVRARG